MNCTSATANPGWVTASTYQKCLISFLGTIGNSISLWCLVHCARTNMSTKFHLIFVFSVLLAISLVILPYVAFINYISAFCKILTFPETLIVTISITSSFLLQLERINFTAVAVLRCLAVLRPLLFQTLSKMSIMMMIEAALCLYVFLPWVLGLSLPSDTVPRLDSHGKTPSEKSLSLGVAHLVASFEGLTLGAEAMYRDNVPPDLCNESPLVSPGHVGATGGGARSKLRLEGHTPPTPPVPLTPLTLTLSPSGTSYKVANRATGIPAPAV
ncbi:uncharacterized protein [Cherax quadricarinatus]|uniref:uncharacterized protein n=1 Tax=Cherax quadricarinatus TaxID=27406 RepID=UPI00387E8200